MDAEKFEDVEADCDYAVLTKHVSVSEEYEVHNVFKDYAIAMHDETELRHSADVNSLELATTSPTGPRWPPGLSPRPRWRLRV